MARPRLAQAVLYTRAPGEVFAARITRVVPTRVAPFARTVFRGSHALVFTQPADESTLESDYAVWLSYAAHDGDEAAIVFAQAAPFDPNGGAGTWAWPPST